MASAVFADWYGVDMMAATRGYLSYWARTSTARRDGRFFKSERQEAELGIIDCSGW